MSLFEEVAYQTDAETLTSFPSPCQHRHG